MTKDELINEIIKEIDIVSDFTYKNFVNSFNYSKDDFSIATKCEASLEALHLFEYNIINYGKHYTVADSNLMGQVSFNYHRKLINRYEKLLENDDLLSSFYSRGVQYSALVKKGIWEEELNDLLEKNLYGTKENNKIELNHTTVPIFGDFNEYVKNKYRFIEGEKDNLKRVSKALCSLFDKFHNGVNNPTSSFYKESSNRVSENNSKEGCYIATMVYGGYNTQEVLVLRNFRDTYLVKYRLGIFFIKMYYFISPYFVCLFQNAPTINKMVKIILDKIVIKLSK
ncbi:MAG: CFI-box-CTERM domain-containing protein [Vicingaceae bacterium]|nr:CFI-box-CTERM domain-containing protein [Vicingaceae bacterium]